MKKKTSSAIPISIPLSFLAIAISVASVVNILVNTPILQTTGFASLAAPLETETGEYTSLAAEESTVHPREWIFTGDEPENHEGDYALVDLNEYKANCSLWVDDRGDHKGYFNSHGEMFSLSKARVVYIDQSGEESYQLVNVIMFVPDGEGFDETVSFEDRTIVSHNEDAAISERSWERSKVKVATVHYDPGAYKSYGEYELVSYSYKGQLVYKDENGCERSVCYGKMSVVDDGQGYVESGAKVDVNGNVVKTYVIHSLPEV